MATDPRPLTTGLARRCYGILAVVAVLLVVDQSVLQPLLIELNGLGPVINLAGRQRMLSQRMTKAMLAVSRDPADASRLDELRESLADWRPVHVGLQAGDASRALPGTSQPDIRQAFQQLEPDFLAMCAAVEEVLADPRRGEQAVASMLAHEQRYLSAMDRIVGLFERDAQQQVRRLRQLGLAGTAAVLMMMAGLARFVLTPATRLIHDQMQQLRQAHDALEARVLERTRALTDANAALEREVAERQAAEERNLQLQSELAHAARVTALGQFATGLAHEINQPLGAITNFAEALAVQVERQPPETTDIRTSASRIRDAALRAGRIVGRMRNFLQQRPPQRSHELLNALIDDVLQICSSEARLHQVELVADCAATRNVVVLVDPIQIQQVLVNLVQNAIQVLGRCDGERRVTLDTGLAGDDAAEIEISDTGSGFPAEMLQRGPAPFRTSKRDGLGMGLSISRSLIQAHGGELHLENLSPRGARLRFTLPIPHAQPRLAAAECVCGG